MTEPAKISRRALLGAGAAGGVALWIGFRHFGGPHAGEPQPGSDDFAPNAYLRIGKDDRVTAIIGATEMGQGIFTSLAMVLADELGARWDAINVEAAPVDPAFGNPIFGGLQATAASTSTAAFYQTTREAAAAARMMLIHAAATRWKVPVSACSARNGGVEGPGGKKASFGALVADATKLRPPAKKEIVLKGAKDFTLIGTPVRKRETPAVVHGKLPYGVDFALPDMLVATVARAPSRYATLRSYDAGQASKAPGVLGVVRLPNGVAVIASSFWAALSGRKLLQVQWDEPEGSKFTSAQLLEEYRRLAQTPGLLAVEKGKIEQGSDLVTAEYSVPYLAHAPMEPLNCTIQASSDGCDVWVGTQYQSLDRKEVARILGYAEPTVRIHTLYMGGGFGRRASPTEDMVVETAEIVKAAREHGGDIAGRPIKNMWPREDDIQGGFYRPMAYDRLEATLGDDGLPSSWLHRIVAQSPAKGNEFAFLIEKGIDTTSVAGARDLPYRIPGLRVELHTTDQGPTVQWMRSVGNVNTCLSVECFLDELAHRAGQDPVEYRRKLLAGVPDSARLLKTLDHVAKMADWTRPLPAGHGRGVAIQDYWGTKLSQVAEVAVSGNTLEVKRVYCAVDCGRVVNPLGAAGQIQGGILFGLSAALCGAITFDGGRPQQTNFDTYTLLRMPQAPEVQVEFIESDADPGGVGEAGVPHIAAAVCNAIFAASGRRIRSLPINAEGLDV
ncbi:molybdopterin-dependent oxidoreductase [Sphingobium sp. H39-3-25]|uniref:xanthine dehydrogenase family protein molybdopterin-binding subunit n=1 Tax=Sphingobium arseniciresistens TaxID=3030834 RepID=UPI0023B9D247|nr:molybdopterin-dependent oxidoreductase [Sphingobium arseniciresistens]